MLVENPDGTQVYGSRRFAAPPSRLWRAFTEPGDMAAWMWGGQADNCVAQSELRVGGKYSVYTDSNASAAGWPSDRVGRLGLYLEIVPEQRLVYTLHWDAPVGYNQRGDVVADEAMLISFRPNGDGCVVELRHVGIPDDGVSADEHGRALAEEFDRLARLVEG